MSFISAESHHAHPRVWARYSNAVAWSFVPETESLKVGLCAKWRERVDVAEFRSNATVEEWIAAEGESGDVGWREIYVDESPPR